MNQPTEHLFPLKDANVEPSQPTGSSAHANTPEQRHAVDFQCPEDTKVTASANGIVILVKDDSNTVLVRKDQIIVDTSAEINRMEFEKGENISSLVEAHTNRIVVLNDDETFSEYAHLKQGSAQVKQGDRVVAEETTLAQTGWSGAMSDPHLHFRVGKFFEGNRHLGNVEAFKSVQDPNAIRTESITFTMVNKTRERIEGLFDHLDL